VKELLAKHNRQQDPRRKNTNQKQGSREAGPVRFKFKDEGKNFKVCKKERMRKPRQGKGAVVERIMKDWGLEGDHCKDRGPIPMKKTTKNALKRERSKVKSRERKGGRIRLERKEKARRVVGRR